MRQSLLRYTGDILDILSRRHYARRNFLTEALGGSEQVARKHLSKLAEQKLIRRHSPNGDGLIEHAYPPHFFRIYSLPARKNKFNWHQVMVDDIMLSIEAACKKHGLQFRDRHKILNGLPFELPCTITHKFAKHTETYAGNLYPDELFAAGEDFYLLEADRATETIDPQTFKQKKSALRNILQYAHVLQHRTYQGAWGIPHVKILNVFDSETHKQNVVAFMRDTLKLTSKSLLFTAAPTLASAITSPQPVLDLITRPLERVGHEPFFINRPQL